MAMRNELHSAGSQRHVLFVLDHFFPFVGGAETLFWELSRSLAKQGDRVSVVTIREPGTPTAETIDGVDIYRVRAPSFCRRYLFILLAIPLILRKARDADVIHASVYASAFPAWLCGALRGKPTVLNVYEVFAEQWQELRDVHWLAGWAFRAYEWLILHLPFTHTVCISQFTQQRLQRVAKTPDSRTSVVYPAVDYAFWNRARHAAVDFREKLGLDGSSFVYLCFGRPGSSKGVDFLVAASARIREMYPGSHLVMLLGFEPVDGYRRIVRQIEDLGLADHVTILDPVPREELPRYLLAADCIVVPSVSEGFGYSAVEAASLGCQVVATSGHAVEEVLAGHVKLVPPRDVRSLADAVLDVAETPHACREVPRRYTLQAHLRGVIDVYEKVSRLEFRSEMATPDVPNFGEMGPEPPAVRTRKMFRPNSPRSPLPSKAHQR